MDRTKLDIFREELPTRLELFRADVLRTASPDSDSALAAAFGLLCEAGEYHQAVTAHYDSHDKAILEAGDVLFYLLLYSKNVGLSTADLVSTISYLSDQANLVYHTLAEVCVVGDAVKKYILQGHTDESVHGTWALSVLSFLCWSFGNPASWLFEAMDKNMEKRLKRYPISFSAELSMGREEDV